MRKLTLRKPSCCWNNIQTLRGGRLELDYPVLGVGISKY